jgi:hypothetical protein
MALNTKGVCENDSACWDKIESLSNASDRIECFVTGGEKIQQSEQHCVCFVTLRDTTDWHKINMCVCVCVWNVNLSSENYVKQ